MITKLEKLVEICKRNAPRNSCEKCMCTERECLIELLDVYNTENYNECIDFEE